MKIPFKEKYGSWAVVAGGSRGVGAAFVRELAQGGMNIFVVARNSRRLDTLAEETASRFGIEVRTLELDLTAPKAVPAIIDATADLDIGLFLYNPGTSNPGPFLERPIESHLSQFRLNCAVPVTLVHHFAGRMRGRGRGAIILMASLTAFIGSPGVAGYGATKAFNLTLAEGVGRELNGTGIDLLVCCAGVIGPETSGRRNPHGRRSLFSPPITPPEKVARSSLRALGRRTVLVPGVLNRTVAFTFQHLLPRPASVRLMERTAAGLDFPGEQGSV